MTLIRSSPQARPLREKWLAKDPPRTPSSPESAGSAESPGLPGSPGIVQVEPYRLAPQYAHLVVSPAEFSAVIRDRIARLQDTLPQLSQNTLRQAKADIVFLRSILEEEGDAIAQVKAGAVYSAAT